MKRLNIEEIEEFLDVSFGAIDISASVRRNLIEESITKVLSSLYGDIYKNISYDFLNNKFIFNELNDLREQKLSHFGNNLSQRSIINSLIMENLEKVFLLYVEDKRIIATPKMRSDVLDRNSQIIHNDFLNLKQSDLEIIFEGFSLNSSNFSTQITLYKRVLSILDDALLFDILEFKRINRSSYFVRYLENRLFDCSRITINTLNDLKFSLNAHNNCHGVYLNLKNLTGRILSAIERDVFDKLKVESIFNSETELDFLEFKYNFSEFIEAAELYEGTVVRCLEGFKRSEDIVNQILIDFKRILASFQAIGSPDSNSISDAEYSFRWGGLSGEEAHIGYWNCD